MLGNDTLRANSSALRSGFLGRLGHSGSSSSATTTTATTSRTAGGMDDAMQRLTKDFKHWSSVGLLSNSAREAAASFEGRLGKLKQYVVSVQAINLILNKLGSLSPDDKRKEVETLLEDVSNRNTSLLKDVLVWLKATAGI
eukprot:TRINITY_DN5780_c0_g1_i1.p1 TRINITY_DN5780_c0_g1~~TRINITY_DN5780_c0_g1_i1.p1  ORF type:complete len:141 (+),score=31.50 TRINITY_DN5780_c0_g1_i1:208-630(+)